MNMIVIACLLLLLGQGVIVQSSEKLQFSHMRLDIGHSLICRTSCLGPNHRVGYNGNVTILHAEGIKNGSYGDVSRKAVLLDYVDLNAANLTVENVLMDVGLCTAPHSVVAETQFQGSPFICSRTHRQGAREHVDSGPRQGTGK